MKNFLLGMSVTATLAIAIFIIQKILEAPPERPKSIATAAVVKSPADLPLATSEEALTTSNRGSVPPTVAATQAPKSPTQYIASGSQPSTSFVSSATPTAVKVAPRGVSDSLSAVSSAPTSTPNQIPPGDAQVVEIPVPRGMVLPAAFSDSGTPLSPAQSAALDSIADEFLETAFPAAGTAVNESSNTATTSNPASGGGTPSPLPANDAQNAGPTITDEDLQNAGGDPADALRLANERYRQLFGHEAFNTWSTRAALEALAD